MPTGRIRRGGAGATSGCRLYEYPLLGEGLARILLGETDAEVAVAPADDMSAMQAVLARQPNVVIFEGRRCERECKRLAPYAALIDVTSAMSAHVSPEAADLGRIILVARGHEGLEARGRKAR